VTKVAPFLGIFLDAKPSIARWFGLRRACSVKDVALLEMYIGWSFFKSLDNTEMSLIKADMDIASLYVDLVPR
jgi:phosphoenolpyruvate carboxylase